MTLSHPSLQLRLGMGLFLSLTFLFTLLLALSNSAVRSLTEERVADRLHHDADSILAALRFDTSDRPHIHEEMLGPYFQRPFSGHYYVVETERDLFRSRSLWDVDPGPFPAGTDDGHDRLVRRSGPQGQPLLALATTFHKQGQTVRILVAEDLGPLEEELSLFHWRLGWVFGGVLLLLMGLQWILLRMGLAPLEHHRRLLEQLKQGEIHTLPEDAPLELLPLVREINHLLDSLRERLERSRNALGNLAHALKTPLAILQRTLEQLPDNAADHPRQLLLEQTERIRILTQRELRRARLAGRAGAQGRMDPAEEIRQLLPVLERIHEEKRLKLRLQAPPEVRFHGDREDFLELAGNLLDNACQWAKNRVEIRLQEENGLLFLVEDDGPGVGEEDLGRLRREGGRVDEQAAGNGLGLAIVGDVVKHYGGTLHFDRSPKLGGLRVQVRLPE